MFVDDLRLCMLWMFNSNILLHEKKRLCAMVSMLFLCLSAASIVIYIYKM